MQGCKNHGQGKRRQVADRPATPPGGLARWRGPGPEKGPTSPMRIRISGELEGIDMTTVAVRGKAVRLDHVAGIEATGRAGTRGPSFRVTLDGETIVGSSSVPTFDACRVLAARGVVGRIGFRHPDGMIGLVVSIDVGAGLAVAEGAGTPRFVKWKPYTGPEHTFFPIPSDHTARFEVAVDADTVEMQTPL